MNDPGQRREEEERMRREARLPPGQSLTNGFPVGQFGPIPGFDPLTWDFRLFGELEEERCWDWPAFNALPRTRVKLDIHCVTRWSKFDTLWEGVSPRQLLDMGIIKLKSSARFVVQHCEAGFTTNLPLEVVLAPNFLLATHFDRRPLEPGHGYPLRAVVGSIPAAGFMTPYFWKGGKWLRALEFLPDDRPGFWERGGYHNDGDVWLEQRRSTPPPVEQPGVLSGCVSRPDRRSLPPLCRSSRASFLPPGSRPVCRYLTERSLRICSTLHAQYE